MTRSTTIWIDGDSPARLDKGKSDLAADGRTFCVRSLGADNVLEYTAGPFEQRGHDVDIVLGTMGGDIPKGSLSNWSRAWTRRAAYSRQGRETAHTCVAILHTWSACWDCCG